MNRVIELKGGIIVKANTTYALIWVSFAVAISVGIVVTGDLTALWAFFIPIFITMKDDK